MTKNPTTRRPLLRALHLHGLEHLDAPVLAALASGSPLLLIGPHGSAKSALLERLAAALRLEHRHYNASLVSFDDLLGFPVPDGEGLRYLRTPGTLWGAQSVFIDEINRCRPEVQNKFFGIVHERRLQGLQLEELRYRWAAMNPPADPESTDPRDEYHGLEPLDAALADRFAWVLALPALADLAPAARRALIADGAPPAAWPEIAPWVEACRACASALDSASRAWIHAYVAALVVPLAQAQLPLSGRRAVMLADNLVHMAAAWQVLGIDGALADAALDALRCSLPHRALGRTPEASLLAAVHREAVAAAQSALEDEDSAMGRILDELDPLRRVSIALDALARDPGSVPRDTMSALVCTAYAAQDRQGQWLLARRLLPRLMALDCVDAATLETVGEPFEAQLEFEREGELRQSLPRNELKRFQALVDWLARLDDGDPEQAALGNLAQALFARHADDCAPERLLAQDARIASTLCEAA